MCCAHAMMVLFFSDNPWGTLYQRPQHLASRLAARWPVVWVEPITLGHPWRVRPHRIAPDIASVSIPLFPYNARSRWLRAVSRLLGGIGIARWTELHLQVWFLRRALRRLGGVDEK